MSATMTAMKIDPVVKTLEVNAPAARAFEVFTAKIDTWWPRATHSLSMEKEKAPAKKIVFEPRMGGRVFEVSPSGAEYDWGVVRAFEPGRRVVFSWHVGRTPDQSTEVEVTFDDIGGGATRVTLTHRDWENFGADAGQIRDGYNAGWEGVFKVAYADAVSAA